MGNVWTIHFTKSDFFQVQEKSLEEFSFLIFSHVTSKHSGEYTCVASNSAAEVNHTARLAVKGKHPSFESVNTKPLWMKNFNNDVTTVFSCAVLGIWTTRCISTIGYSNIGSLCYKRVSGAKSNLVERAW